MTPPPELSGATFHHIGVVCADIDKETTQLAALGYAPEGEMFSDYTQGVRGQFLIGIGPRLELLSPLGEGRVLSPWIKSGVKMYHLAFTIPIMETGLRQLLQNRGRTVVHPVSAVAFGGRQIAFVMLPNLMLIELISEV